MSQFVKNRASNAPPPAPGIGDGHDGMSDDTLAGIVCGLFLVGGIALIIGKHLSYVKDPKRAPGFLRGFYDADAATRSVEIEKQVESNKRAEANRSRMIMQEQDRANSEATKKHKQFSEVKEPPKSMPPTYGGPAIKSPARPAATMSPTRPHATESGSTIASAFFNQVTK